MDLRPAVVEATLAAVEQWAPGKLSSGKSDRSNFPAHLQTPSLLPPMDAIRLRMKCAGFSWSIGKPTGRSSSRHFPVSKTCWPRLADVGVAVVVTSGSMRAAGSSELEASGLGSYVSATVFQDDIARPKPYADAALRALEVGGTSSEDALLIGDSDLDIQCGRLAGISTGAALWGALDRVSLLAEEPDFALEFPSEVVEIVRKGEK